MNLRILALLVLSAATVMLAADAKFTLPPETTQLKPGPGAELVTAQCLLCHSADYISTQPRLSRVQWQAGVIKMQQKYGAPITTNSIERLVDYLSSNYGSTAAGAK
jgi:cytochrome c553